MENSNEIQEENLIEVNYQPYIKKNYFFSVAEVKFYDLLKEILGDKYLIFPKVRISDLVQPKYGKEKYIYFNKIKSKHVDFLVCDKNPVKSKVIIELDDSSHDKRNRQERDEFVDEVFANVGIPIAHVRVRQEYKKEEIIKQIQEACKIKYVIKSEDDGSHPVAWWRGCLASLSVFVFVYLIISF